MGMTPPQHTGIGVDDYLAGELQSEVRHENTSRGRSTRWWAQATGTG
jgi:hypothetical protein